MTSYSISEYLNAAKKTGSKKRIRINGKVAGPKTQTIKLIIRDGVTCVCCGIKGTQFSNKLNMPGYHLIAGDTFITKDHIIPRAKGGTNTMDNYQLMCFICNQAKADNVVAI